MRSRPTVQLRLRPGAVNPGQSLEVDALFVSRSDTPIEWVEMRLEGWESAWYGAGDNAARTRHRHVGLVVRHTPGAFTRGQHRLRGRFPIPRQAPPSFKGTYASVEYTLALYVSIPWWPDVDNHYAVPVIAQPVAHTPEPGVFTTSQSGPAGRDLYAELSLDSTRLTPGGVVSGALSLSNLRHHSVRGVKGTFVLMETITVSQQGEVHRGAQYDVLLCEKPQAEGESIPFRVRLPDKIPCDTQGAFFRTRWYLEVTALEGWGTTPLLRIPITITHDLEPGGERASNPARWDTSVPTVGRARHAAIWSRVGQPHGLLLDPNRLALHGRVGAIDVHVHEEQEPGVGATVVVSFAWPSLGINLRVAPAGAVSRWWGRVRNADTRSRSEVRARYEHQAAAVLDETLLHTLESMGDAELHDEGGRVVTRTGTADASSLTALLARVMTFARQLTTVFRALPPPPALPNAVEPWRAFAERYAGRYSPGTVAVHDAHVQGEQLSLAHHWDDDGSFDALYLTLQLDAPITVSIDDATDLRAPLVEPSETDASANVMRACQELFRMTARVDGDGSPKPIELSSATARQLVVRVAGRVTDPARLSDVIDQLVRIARVARGARTVSPFRA